MRKWTPTIIAVVLLIAGWVYAASHNYFREEQAVPTKLLGIQTADIQLVTIQGKTKENDGSEMSTLQWVKGSWHMTEPKDYPLNQYSVGSWLDALSAANQEQMVEETPTDLEKYGLGKDAIRLDIRLKDHRELKLAIGGSLPTGDERYVRVGEGAVVAVKSDAVNNVVLTRHDLMDTTPFNMDESHVSLLEWEGEGASWMLRSKAENGVEGEQTWTLNGTSIEATDAVSLIDQIKNLSTGEDVRKSSELKGAIPRFTLSVEQQVNGQQVNDVYRGLTLPSDPNHIWIITPDGSWAYALDTSSLNEAEKFPSTIKASKASSVK